MKAILACIVVVITGFVTQALAQSPREAFQTAVEAYQQKASEAAVENLAKLYKEMTPPPAIPEKAEFHAQKGAAFVELAKTPADYLRAAQQFQAAIAIAPWVGEYHYNLAICYKSAEQFASAVTSLQFAQILARDEKERREAVALRAKIEAAQEVTTAQKAEDLAKAKKAKVKNLIVPGVGVGEIKLGMSESEVIAIWGAPSERYKTPWGGTSLQFGNRGVTVVVRPNRGVTTINISSRDFITAEGMGVGVQTSQLSSAIGSPYRQLKDNASGNIWWCYRGVSFFLDKKSEASLVSVEDVNDTCE